MPPKRFIVLCHQRSGSTLLVRALQQHPDVRMYGELLTNTEDEPTRRRLHSVGGRWFADGGDGAEFLRYLFASTPQAAAIGFKLMHYHAADGPAATAWELLRRDRALSVVHLRRDDLLECLVSDEVAQRTRTWHVSAGAPLPEEPAPFALSVERCRTMFEQQLGFIARARAWFGDHPLLELEYRHDLETAFEGATARVFDFLGVRPIAVEPRLSKLARRTPREQLANFDELAAAFAATPFARFFASSA